MATRSPGLSPDNTKRYQHHRARLLIDQPALARQPRKLARLAIRAVVDDLLRLRRAGAAPGGTKVKPENKLTDRQRKLFNHFRSTKLYSKEEALELARRSAR